MIIALNDLEVESGNILNAYVQAPVKKRVWTTLSLKFGKDSRMTALIFRAFYDLNSTGAAFRSHLVRCIESLACESCKADIDLWLRIRSQTKR